MQFRFSRGVSCTRNLRGFNPWRHFCTRNDNTMASFHLIGSGACGDPSSFYLQARNARYVQKRNNENAKLRLQIHLDCRYIFNCGEGVARLAQANDIRLTTVENVFFTQTKWRQIGGLGSLLKLIWEQKKSQIMLHGAWPLGTVTTRILASMNIPTDWEICKFNEMATHHYEGSALRIDFIPLQSNDSKNSEKN